jgi:hypothetical protein
MPELYTRCIEETMHIIPEKKTPVYPDCETMLQPCRFSIYEKCGALPEDTSETIGEYIGCMDGVLVMGGEIVLRQPFQNYKSDLLMNLICDDYSADLGFVVSALLKDKGPLSMDQTEFGCDHFYIDEIELKRPELLPRILRDLPDIVFRHMHVYPELISYYPRPLPHEPEELTSHEEMLLDLAERTKSAVMILLIRDENIMRHPQIALTPEMLTLLRSIQESSTSYDKQYIDKNLWQPFLDNGFMEWQNTRVLYRCCERD